MKKALITIIIGIILVAGSYGVFQYNKYKEKPITDILTHLEDSKVSSITVDKIANLKIENTYQFDESETEIIKSLKELKVHRTKSDFGVLDCEYSVSLVFEKGIDTVYLYGDKKEIIIATDTESWGNRHFKASSSDFFDIVETLIANNKEHE
ncbi:hypothetical protein JFL43_09790 [Viridibacillus sp. YIM B01967]|uniref:Uncharacterized protein n=1 Tax=Viridibacillus soli TaxID=2798301 RepID=A0ABS1H755_9BACL|nr:hypothetical protein [Viridibacillus soli]MBK3495141.1 hypothetical protein [Viridibacillus soli]